MKPMLQSNLKSLPFLHRGKVRDIYAVGDDKLLVVQTDRLSAFDVILPDPIPEKGSVLTRLSLFWFDKLGHVVPNHLTGIAPESVVADDERDQVAGRAMVVKKLKPLMIEAVVRGYVVGSGWKDYQATGAICGIKLPAGMRQAEKLPEPIFTPATKAPAGQHDENISYDEAAQDHRRRLRTPSPRHLAPPLQGSRRLRRDTRHHHRRHQARIRRRRARNPPLDRRDPDTGLVALLAQDELPHRHQPAILRQTIRPRLARIPTLEQEGPRAAPAPRRAVEDLRKIPRSA